MQTPDKRTQLIAFNGDVTLKADILAELADHRRLDKIIRGTYGTGSNGDWKGCAVGCSIHSLNAKRGTKHAWGDHSAYESGFGIPRQLACLEDRMFENLPNGLHLAWPERFMGAVNTGADLSLVMARFMVWLLVDADAGVIRFAKKERTHKAIRGVAELYQRLIDGGPVSSEEWKKARSAAYAAAAYAADAYAADAYADAYAADAYAAAYAAADAATAYDAADARSNHWVLMADKVIELIDNAPMAVQS